MSNQQQGGGRFGWIVASIVVALLAGCGGEQQRAAERKRPQPQLVIISPKPQGVSEAIDVRTTKGSIRLEGQLRNAPAGSRVVVDDEEIPISPGGTFADKVILNEGGNVVRVEARVPGVAPLVEEVNISRTLTAEQRAKRDRRREQQAREERERLAQIEVEEEQQFRAEARRIDPKQLIKSPDEYIGEQVVYEGQVFQILEEAGTTTMLLSLTNEGYGFWTDEALVTFDGEIGAVEEDIITVYGTVEGATSYETRIGGTNDVPQIMARYIDE